MPRTHLALLRGINLGGSNKVPMAELRAMAERLGWMDVATHVNSGNLVFTAPDPNSTCETLEQALAAAVEAFLGKPVQTIVLTADAWRDAVAACPFTPEEDKFVHIQVHRAPLPDAAVSALTAATEASDDGTELVVRGRWYYVHTPHGLSRSTAFTDFVKLVPKGDRGTARNLNSSKAIVRLLDA